MHGASMVVLHISPLSVIVLVQQADCRPGTRRGMLSSEGRTSSYVHWLRDFVYRDKLVRDENQAMTQNYIPNPHDKKTSR